MNESSMPRLTGTSSLCLTLAGALVLSGCGGGETSPPPVVKRSGGAEKETPKPVKKHPADNGEVKKPE